MIDGQRYSASFPTEADAALWEAETRAAVVRRRRVASVIFGVYVEGWLEGFIDDAPDRVRFEAALQRGLFPMLGQLPLLEMLESDWNELSHRLVQSGVDMDDRAAWECLREVLEDAAEDLRRRCTGCGGDPPGDPGPDRGAPPR